MNTPSLSIRSRLTRMLLLSSCAVLAITSSAFCAYEFLNFRESSVQQLEILSQAIASNSTAALAFDNAEDAAGVLAAFSADPHIVAAALYDAQGKVFATYPKGLDATHIPAKAGESGHHFTRSALIRIQAVMAGADRLGMLYVESDLDTMYARITRYALIVLLVVGVSLALAYLISRRLQHQLLAPILALGNTARAISERSDYGVRASRSGTTEIDLFTDTFNQMLTQIQGSERKLRDQLSRLSLLQHITRATGERQDLPSIFQVVLGSLEANLPIDFGCFLLYDADERSLTVSGQRSAGCAFAETLQLSDGAVVPIDKNGLARCIAGNLVYEPDVRAIQFPFPQRLAAAGLRSLVIAPLIVENQVFGVLITARRQEQAFSSGECEFIKQ